MPHARSAIRQAHRTARSRGRPEADISGTRCRPCGRGVLSAPDNIENEAEILDFGHSRGINLDERRIVCVAAPVPPVCKKPEHHPALHALRRLNGRSRCTLRVHAPDRAILRLISCKIVDDPRGRQFAGNRRTGHRCCLHPGARSADGESKPLTALNSGLSGPLRNRFVIGYG